MRIIKPRANKWILFANHLNTAGMPRKFLKRFLPDHDKIRRNETLNRVFGRLLHDPNLLHINRRSVSGAFFVGLAMAFVPIPFQMAPAAGLAIYFRVNLPIAVSLVWITNPITMPPMYYFFYELGQTILGGTLEDIVFEASFEWLQTVLGEIWQPFLLGSFIVGLGSATLGYVCVRLLWRLQVVRRWQKRKDKRKNLV